MRQKLKDENKKNLLKLINLDNIPQHIAIIMDGNRRWARERSLPAVMGHKAGVKAFRKVVETCIEIGVKVLTVYAFSSENWRRSEDEVNILLQLFKYYARKERENLKKNGVRFRIIGNLEELPESLRREFIKTQEATENNEKLILNLAVNYSSRGEILQAVKKIVNQVKEGSLNIWDIDERVFSKNLWTGELSEPDLLIRTSGELRISNFLLWQIAYTELWFTHVYWPDFTKEHLLEAIMEYGARIRRFGGN